MQIPPGDAFPYSVSGSVAQPRPGPRQAPTPQTQPPPQAQAAPAGAWPGAARNSPPPVQRAHAVERIAQAQVPRAVPRGSLIDIEC